MSEVLVGYASAAEDADKRGEAVFVPASTINEALIQSYSCAGPLPLQGVVQELVTALAEANNVNIPEGEVGVILSISHSGVMVELHCEDL